MFIISSLSLLHLHNKSIKRGKYCRSCGTFILEEATFCPNCGARQSLESQTPTRKEGLANRLSKSSRKIRVTLFTFSLLLFLSMLLLGTLTPLPEEEAKSIVKEFESMIGRKPSAATIIRNNLSLCLMFFIPGFGTALLAFVGYSTGTVLSAVAYITSQQDGALLLFLSTITFPWAWLEFTAYSLASAEGIMFVLSILARRFRQGGKRLILTLGVNIVLIVVGGFIEAYAISMLSA